MVDMKRHTVIVSDDSEAPSTIRPWKMTSKQDRDLKSPGVTMQDIVQRVYGKFRTANREPSEPFLRVSARVTSEGRPLWQKSQSGDTFPARNGQCTMMLIYGDMGNTRHTPSCEQKLCLYILDGPPEQLQPFSLVARLLWHLHEDIIYATIRKGTTSGTSKKGQDNRNDFRFKFEESEDKLKISREDLRRGIFDWIRSVTPTVAEEPGLLNLNVDRIIKDIVGSGVGKGMAQLENQEDDL